MKFACDLCGTLDDERWIWSGLCQACWWLPRAGETPAVCLPGADLNRDECALCGVLITGGELCTRCNDDI